MNFTHKTLKDLKRGQLCLVKYSTVSKSELARVATAEPLNQVNIKRYPIFDETKTKAYFHFLSETFPVPLDINKIEGILPFEFQYNYQFFLNMKGLMDSLEQEK